MFYDNAVCDGCGKPLLENEDVVVCPVCGTPQHRSCYELNNKCVNEHLHESGFEWKNPNPQPEEPVFTRPEPEEAQPDGEPFPNVMPTAALDVNPVFYQKSGLNPEDEFDGVKVREAVSYTQVGAKNYVRKFLRADGRKRFVSWNWGAFFFAPAWFFYRKLYKLGFIFLGLSVAINLFLLPQTQMVADNIDSMNAAYTEFTEAYKTYSQEQTPENEAAVNDAQAKVQGIINKISPATAIIFISDFLIPNIAAALIADSFYKRRLVDDIKFAHKSTNDQNVIKYALLRRGGVALLPAFAALLAESYIPDFIIQTAKYFILK